LLIKLMPTVLKSLLQDEIIIIKRNRYLLYFINKLIENFGVIKI